MSWRRGAVFGAELWLAYAIVECWLLGILPRLWQPAYDFRPTPATLTLLLFAGYPMVGALLGALAGMVMRTADSLRVAAIGTLVFAYALNCTILIGAGPELVMPLASCAAVLLAALVAAGRPATSALRVFLNPWWAAALLVGMSWTTKDALQFSSAPVKLAAALVFAFVVTAIIATIARRPPARARGARFWIAAAATFAMSLVVRSGARINPLPNAAATTAASAPSVVLVTMDTVRADHLPIYGYKGDTAPALRALAGRATVYTRALATSDVTPASHTSLFTGLYPSQHGVHTDDNWPVPHPLPSTATTLAGRLAAAGYRTMAVVANPGYLGHRAGLDNGFEHFDERVADGALLDDPSESYVLRQGARRLLQRLTRTDLSEVLYRRADEINRAALPLVDAQKDAGRPFFLFINYMDAHWPYRPPPPFDTRFGGTGAARRLTRAAYYALAADVIDGKATLSDDLRRDLQAQYDGGIGTVDEHIGELIDRLERRGLLDNCLVIVTADHGEAFGEHGLVEHGVSVYGDQIHVPLVVKYPGQKAPRIVDEVVSGVDVFATVLDVTGLPIPSGIEGRSLRRDDEPHDPARRIVSESFPVPGANPRLRRVERAIVAGGVKFISSTAGKRELYDIDDVGDEHDLAAMRPDIVGGLERTLREWVAAITRSDVPAGRLDRRTLQQLRSLGYVR